MSKKFKVVDINEGSEVVIDKDFEDYDNAIYLRFKELKYELLDIII